MDFRDKSVVVMPAANRPEFCALALEQLGRARFCPTIFLNVDDVNDKLKEDFEYVFRNYFPKNVGGTFVIRDSHIKVTSGCWNILESIRNGYNVGAEYVFLVEEDILVMPDFFEYHWEQMDRGAIVSCGRRCRMFYPRSPGTYTNPGSALTRELLDALIPHVNDEFYKDTGGYMDREIGHVEGIHGLDDGLIRRVIWKNGWQDRVVYPPMETPMCAHTGFQAYENRFDFCHVDTTQSIQGKIDNLRHILKTIDRQGEKAKYIKDLDPFPPELL
jgi:hypothetical protein